jgi:hypothetical protein
MRLPLRVFGLEYFVRHSQVSRVEIYGFLDGFDRQNDVVEGLDCEGWCGRHGGGGVLSTVGGRC